MAAPYTGRKLTLTVNSVDISAITTECTFTPSQDTYTTKALSANYSTVDPLPTWELSINGLQDYNAATSFLEAMWTAAAAGTAITASIEVDGGGTASGSVIPVYPGIGGPADAVNEFQITMPVTGQVTYTP